MRIIQIIIVNDQILNLSPSFFSILSTFCSSSKICSVCLFNSLFVTTSSVETYTLTATSEKNEGICQRQYNPARYIDPTTTLIALTIRGLFDFDKYMAFFIIVCLIRNKLYNAATVANVLTSCHVNWLLGRINCKRFFEDCPASTPLLHTILYGINIMSIIFLILDKIIYFPYFQLPFHEHLSSHPMLFFLSSFYHRFIPCRYQCRPGSLISAFFLSFIKYNLLMFFHANFAFLNLQLHRESQLACWHFLAKLELFFIV